MDREVFVQNIEKYCAQKNIRPTNACRDSGVGGSFVTDIKRGQTPSVAKVQLLAQYLGCTVSDLLGEEVGTQNSPPSEDDELRTKINALSPAGRKRAGEYLDFLLNLEEKP